MRNISSSLNRRRVSVCVCAWCVSVCWCVCGVCQLSTFVRRFACEMLILLGRRGGPRGVCVARVIKSVQIRNTHTHTHTHSLNGNLIVRVQNSISDICKCHNSQLCFGAEKEAEKDEGGKRRGEREGVVW